MKNQKKEKKIFNLIKKIKLRHIMILIVLLAFNTYAWFIYATKVSAGLNAYVTSWNVSFEAGESGATTNIVIDVDKIYPGMTTYTKIISVHNRGETAANLTYRINSYTLLGTTYQTDGATLTSDMLVTQLQNNYPFKVNVAIQNGNLVAGSGDGTYTITVTWPYESGDDATDTLWGGRAYDYYEANPGSTSLHIDMDLQAEQNNG